MAVIGKMKDQREYDMRIVVGREKEVSVKEHETGP